MKDFYYEDPIEKLELLLERIWLVYYNMRLDEQVQELENR